MNAIVLPVSAGDSAFHSLGRWCSAAASRWSGSKDRLKGYRRIAIVFRRGKPLENAATSGAVAISVPVEFAPLVIGRWELVDWKRKIVNFEDSESWRSPDEIIRTQLNFRKPSATFERYLPFILPPDVEFGHDYLSKEHKIQPSSSALSSIIGIVQIGLSIRQLSVQYGSSIASDGLSSPYLAVIPYMLMSFVNLAANALVGQYRQVTMLPMKKTTLPEANRVYIIKCLYKNCPGKRNCPGRILGLGHRRRVVSVDRSTSGERGSDWSPTVGFSL